MWKCPSCGTVNRGDVCVQCGLAKKPHSGYKPQMSALRLISAIIASFVIIVLIFVLINSAFDARNRRRARDYSNEGQFSNAEGSYEPLKDN